MVPVQVQRHQPDIQLEKKTTLGAMETKNKRGEQFGAPSHSHIHTNEWQHHIECAPTTRCVVGEAVGGV